QALHLDPILVGFIASPGFFLLGVALYRVYYASFEKHGDDSLGGLSFFFGVLFITEVSLVLIFGVDYRSVDPPYIGITWPVGTLGLPLRLVIPFAVSLAMVVGLQLMLSTTFFGRAMQAVSQDRVALQLMAANPVRVKEWGFALSIATASVAG